MTKLLNGSVIFIIKYDLTEVYNDSELLESHLKNDEMMSKQLTKDKDLEYVIFWNKKQFW